MGSVEYMQLQKERKKHSSEEEAMRMSSKSNSIVCLLEVTPLIWNEFIMEMFNGTEVYIA